jgi:hypothetical protein
MIMPDLCDNGQGMEEKGSMINGQKLMVDG